MRLADARLLDGSLVDIDLAGEAIARVSPAGSTPSAGERIALDGAPVVPGLWDAHTHMAQWALFRARPSVLDAPTAAAAALVAREAAAAHPGPGPLVLVGMRDGLWPDAPTAALLDAATGDVPTLVVSSDVHSSWPNTAMARLLGREPADALFREEEAFDVLTLVDRMLERAAVDRLVVDALAAAASRGVVGVVDLDFDDAVGAWLRGTRRTPARVRAGVYPAGLELLAERGLRGGDALAGRAQVGPFKVITDGSLGTRTAWTAEPYGHDHASHGVVNVGGEELDRLLVRAGELGLDAAVHAIGDAAVAAAIDALERAGRGGRIEHAQLVAAADVPRMARAGIVASVQPEHALDDRELTGALWADRSHDAYRLRSFLDAGVALSLGSDAPVTPLDPWLAIATAVTRTRGDERPWQPEEAIGLEEAVTASAPTSIRAGQPADLVVLDAAPPTAAEVADGPNGAAARLRAMPVRATLVAGEAVFGTLG